MKHVVIFFLYLCFYLLGGSNYASANTYNSNVPFSSTYHITNTQKIGKGYHNFNFTKSADVAETDVPLLSVEDEEEHTISKLLLQARYFLAFSYTFILNYSFRSSVDRLPSCVHFSYIGPSKYIVQRAIRI